MAELLERRRPPAALVAVGAVAAAAGAALAYRCLVAKAERPDGQARHARAREHAGESGALEPTRRNDPTEYWDLAEPDPGLAPGQP